MSRTITALFDQYQDAAEAVRALEEAGVPAGNVSVVSNDAAERDRYGATPTRDVDEGGGAGTGPPSARSSEAAPACWPGRADGHSRPRPGGGPRLADLDAGRGRRRRRGRGRRRRPRRLADRSRGERGGCARLRGGCAPRRNAGHGAYRGGGPGRPDHRHPRRQGHGRSGRALGHVAAGGLDGPRRHARHLHRLSRSASPGRRERVPQHRPLPRPPGSRGWAPRASAAQEPA